MAAAQWSMLSAEYAAVADELSAVLGAVQGGVWEGPTAEQYVAAHLPYLAWLSQASATSASAATQHETAAAAYAGALAAMPTLAELAANHAIHAVLVATNFFGVNTIPIALNEADYVRMWVQAATAMSTYEAVTDTALMATPATSPAPQILHAEASDDDHDEHDEHEGHEHGDPTQLDYLVADLLRTLTGGQINWDPLEETMNGIPMHDYTDATQPLWWVVRSLEFGQQFETFVQELFTDPAGALEYVIQLAEFDWPTHLAQLVPLLQSPQLLAVAMSGALANLGVVTGFAGLSGLAAVQPAPVPFLPPPAAAAPALLPSAGMAPTITASAAPAAPAPAPASVASTVAGAAPPPPPAPVAAGFGFPFLVGGGPGIGYGSGMGATASASAKKKAPEPDSAAVGAAAAAREQARRRRRRRSAVRDHADEYLHVGVDPVWEPPPDDATAVSDRGAGELGFAGTVAKPAVDDVAGLATLGGGEFGSAPTTPMLPNTWDASRN